MTGLLLDGQLHDVSGLRIIPPADHGGPAWNRLGVVSQVDGNVV